MVWKSPNELFGQSSISFFPSCWIECLPCASHCVGQNPIQLNHSWCWGLIYLLDGHLPPGQWESHSWTQLVGFCRCQEASDLGCHSWRVKWEMSWHPALPFFYSPSFPWSNLLLHSGRGNGGSGQDSCSPRHSGSSLLSTAEAKCHW